MLKELLNIDEKLRTVFSRLEQILSVQFDTHEMDRVFSDSEHDQVSPKRYIFHQAGRVSVSGSVDDYEPETLWLCIECADSLVASCSDILKEYDRRVA
jgi:hypothetical protein